MKRIAEKLSRFEKLIKDKKEVFNTFLFFIHKKNNKYRCIYRNELVGESENVEGVKFQCLDFAKKKTGGFYNVQFFVDDLQN